MDLHVEFWTMVWILPGPMALQYNFHTMNFQFFPVQLTVKAKIINTLTSFLCSTPYFLVLRHGKCKYSVICLICLAHYNVSLVRE